ncbi:MAG TPA: XrtB/PEP-CTERM-associated transcriptional regulator EpsA [Steroidobacteraceae bacterium]|nr:XrtB/PEP-CTERM-associated transcriptional regulator EpsA [Steroidobacteraceae bacterium]
MHTESVVAERPGLRVMPPAAERAAERTDPRLEAAATARLEAAHVEGLLLNLDDALRVRTRAQFFAWTQGLLQNLIPHSVLVCALRRGATRSFAVDGFSTLVGDAAAFGELLMRETPLASMLAESWRQHRHLPVLCGLNEFAALAANPCVRELRRAGATDLLVHGSHDADGEVQGMCVFACQAGAIGPREIYLVQLMAPSLHAAWMRTQSRIAAEDVRLASTGNGTLTERERGILRWVYLGKSNGEIGAILNISALTVKNHMQKILRKLNVVNRAQAVGKALDARIIRP